MVKKQDAEMTGIGWSKFRIESAAARVVTEMRKEQGDAEIWKLGVVKEFGKSWRVRRNCCGGGGCEWKTCGANTCACILSWVRSRWEVDTCDRCDCLESLGSPGLVG